MAKSVTLKDDAILRDIRPGEMIRFHDEKKPFVVKQIDRCDSWPLSYMHVNTKCAPRNMTVERWETIETKTLTEDEKANLAIDRWFPR